MKRFAFLLVTLSAFSAHAASNPVYVNSPFQQQQLGFQKESLAALQAQNDTLKAMQEQQQKQIETLEKILQYQAAQLQIIKQQYELLNKAAPAQ